MDATDLVDSVDSTNSAELADSSDSADSADLADSYFNPHLDRLGYSESVDYYYYCYYW